MTTYIRCICGLLARKPPKMLCTVQCMHTVLANPTGDMGCHDHIYTVYMRYFWPENHRIYSHIRLYSVCTRFWPTLQVTWVAMTTYIRCICGLLARKSPNMLSCTVQCMHTVLANPTGDMGCHDHIYTVYTRYFWSKITKYTVIYGVCTRFWPTLQMTWVAMTIYMYAYDANK